MNLTSFIDIETTGLFTPDHKIVEIYSEVWDLDTKTRLRFLDVRINPQRSISVEAQRVHGISASDLIACPVFSAIADRLVKHLEGVELIVAHNGLAFDIPFINQELDAAGKKQISIACCDTMLECRWSTPNGKVPSLSDLCFACGINYDQSKAHAASYDVDVMRQCYFEALKWGFFPMKGAETIES